MYIQSLHSHFGIDFLEFESHQHECHLSRFYIYRTARNTNAKTKARLRSITYIYLLFRWYEGNNHDPKSPSRVPWGWCVCAIYHFWGGGQRGVGGVSSDEDSEGRSWGDLSTNASQVSQVLFWPRKQRLQPAQKFWVYSEFLSFFSLYSRLLADFLSHLGKWVKLIEFEAENEFFCTWKVENPRNTTSSP